MRALIWSITLKLFQDEQNMCMNEIRRYTLYICIANSHIKIAVWSANKNLEIEFHFHAAV